MRFPHIVYTICSGLLVIVLCAVVFFCIDVRSAKTHVPDGIMIGGLIPVGGLTYHEAFEKVSAVVARARSEKRTVTTDSDKIWEKTLQLSEFAPFILEKDVVDAVHTWNSEGNLAYQFVRWIKMLIQKDTYVPVSVPVQWTGDIHTELEKILSDFEKKVKTPHITTPTSLRQSLEDSLFSPYPSVLLIASDRGLVTKPSFTIPERLYLYDETDQENGYNSVLSYDHLYALLLGGDMLTTDEWFINTQLLRKITRSSDVRNAVFDVTDPASVAIVPSRAGTVLDYLSISNKLMRAITEGKLFVEPEYAHFVEPTFTTVMAEALNIKHLVASFTTYHSAGATRVHNIHRIADIVDNAVVQPGEQFNLNAYVGKRTPGRGFKKAGMIFMGELVDDFGGGVSQFATTLYNASFWGGYKDIQHKAHSWYFSRYPEGIEATVSWPEVDLIFENDYVSGLLIKTHYTDTSITVELYGNNDGRIVVGEHRYGKTVLDIVNAGGAMARAVTGTISSRYNIREPGVKFILDTNKAMYSSPGEHSGAKGWTVTVYRTVTKPYRSEEGEIIIEKEETSWPVHYSPEAHVIYVHDCIAPVVDPAAPIIRLKNCAPPAVR